MTVLLLFHSIQIVHVNQFLMIVTAIMTDVYEHTTINCCIIISIVLCITIIVVNIVFMLLTGTVDKMMNAIILIDVCNDFKL